VDAVKEWRKNGEKAEVVSIDGIKLVYSDNSWLLLRPSGTEPVFRVYAESQDPATVQKLIKIGSELIKNAITRAQSLT
jgi:phosphomannomutase